jgi:hypothetical protein
MSFQFTNLSTIDTSQDNEINILKNKVPNAIPFGQTLTSNNNQNVWEYDSYKKINVTASGTNFYFNDLKLGNDGEITFNLEKNQKYFFDCNDLAQKSLNLRFSDKPDGTFASGIVISNNINYYSNFITLTTNFDSANLLFPYCSGTSGYSGTGNNSSYITFNDSPRLINGNRNLKINDNLLVNNINSIDLTLPNNAKNSDEIKLMLISSGTVNLISNNFLINNVSGSVNISSNKEIYFYDNTWVLIG